MAEGGEQRLSPADAAPLLSVVLPNYNHADLVGRALNALLAQERPADEIIVIDDGSTDNSVAVIERFAARTPSIRCIKHAANKGVIAALAHGLQEACGKHVYFAAADDYVLPGFFEHALRELGRNPDVGLYCGETILVDGVTGRLSAVRPTVRPVHRRGRVEPAKVARRLRESDNWIVTGSAILRRDCVLWAGGFDTRLGTFADGFMVRKIALKYGFIFDRRYVSVWALLSTSVSRRTALELEKTKNVLDVVPRLIAADPIFPAWYADLFRNRWRFATCRLGLVADPIDKELVLAMGARTATERAILRKLLATPGRPIARMATLATLWYWLRPVGLLPLLQNGFATGLFRIGSAFRFGKARNMKLPSAAKRLC